MGAACWKGLSGDLAVELNPSSDGDCKNRVTEEEFSVMGNWVRDSEVDACAQCEKELYKKFVRSQKHHCRRCGRIFCDKCSDRRVPLPEIKPGQQYRVCDECFKHMERKEDFEANHLTILLTGHVFTLLKTGIMGPSSTRVVLRLDGDAKTLVWHKYDDKKKVVKESLMLANIKVILSGHLSEAFLRTGKPERQQLAFSLVAGSRTLDLEAESEGVRDVWVEALQKAVRLLELRSPEEARAAEENQRAGEREAVRKREAALTKNADSRNRLRDLRLKNEQMFQQKG